MVHNASEFNDIDNGLSENHFKTQHNGTGNTALNAWGVQWITTRGWQEAEMNNGRDGVSNHQPHHSLLNRLFGGRWKKTLKLRVTGLCAGNSPVTGEFPVQMGSNAEMLPFDDVII